MLATRVADCQHAAWGGLGHTDLGQVVGAGNGLLGRDDRRFRFVLLVGRRDDGLEKGMGLT